MKKFIQIIDDLPHLVGLVFEVEKETDDRFWIFDIKNDNDEVLFSGGLSKSICSVIEQKNVEYCEILLQRTKIILEFQKDK